MFGWHEWYLILQVHTNQRAPCICVLFAISDDIVCTLFAMSVVYYFHTQSGNCTGEMHT